MKLAWAAFAIVCVAAPDLALACTPAPPNKLSEAEQLEGYHQIADAAARPVLAEQLRAAADISVVSVVGYEPGFREDIPPSNWHSMDWYAREGLLPVRYTVRVERRIKGDAPDVFPFRFWQLNTTSEREWAWAVAPSEDFYTFALARSEPAFWATGRLFLGQGLGGPGDCSNQIALDPKHRYLVLRDADGLVTVAEALEPADPLPNMVAAMLAKPEEDYIWRPTVREYLALDGDVIRLRVIDCAADRLEIVELLADRSKVHDLEAGKELKYLHPVPSLAISACEKGAEFVMTGWPRAQRLHTIRDGRVEFEDRWMQIRFSGEKVISLNTLRAILAGG